MRCARNWRCKRWPARNGRWPILPSRSALPHRAPFIARSIAGPACRRRAGGEKIRHLAKKNFTFPQTLVRSNQSTPAQPTVGVGTYYINKQPAMTIHPSHRNEAHHALRVICATVLVLASACVLATIAGIQSVGHYLPMHMSLEILSVIIAALVFVTGWHNFQQETPGNLRLAATLFLGVALFDFSHTLTYPGMPDFFTPNTREKTNLFWLAARTLAAAALLVAAFGSWEKSALSRWITVPLVAVVAGLHVWFLYYPHTLPATYIQGESPTLATMAYEYGLILAYGIAALALLRHTSQPRRFNASGLFAASALMAMSEFLLVHFADIYDTYNLLAHLYKCAAYLFLY